MAVASQGALCGPLPSPRPCFPPWHPASCFCSVTVTWLFVERVHCPLITSGPLHLPLPLPGSLLPFRHCIFPFLVYHCIQEARPASVRVHHRASVPQMAFLSPPRHTTCSLSGFYFYPPTTLRMQAQRGQKLRLSCFSLLCL